MSITKLMQDIEGDTWDKLSVKESCRCAVCEKRIRGFIHSAQTRLLEEVVREIENQKTEMKETHICAFNDGEQNCDCYLNALSDIIRKLTR